MGSVNYDKTTQEIILAAGLQPDPEFYIGARGRPENLRLQQLQTIYRELRRRISEAAASNFCLALKR